MKKIEYRTEEQKNHIEIVFLDEQICLKRLMPIEEVLIEIICNEKRTIKFNMENVIRIDTASYGLFANLKYVTGKTFQMINLSSGIIERIRGSRLIISAIGDCIPSI